MKKKILQRTKPSKDSLRKIKSLLPDKKIKTGKAVKIPVYKPEVTQKDIKIVSKAVASGWISSIGPFVRKFEAGFAKKVSGTKYALSVNSGSSAVHLAVRALGIGPGDEVIMPTFTMIATANAVSFSGASPILVDADAATWNIDVKKIEEKITKRTRAIIAVHIYGLPCDMDAIIKLAKKYNLWVIEDAAEAQGAEYLDKKTGSMGDIAAFSLYGNKVVTTGEGGMVTTSRRDLAEVVNELRNNGFGKERHFWHEYKGFGYRLSNIQAALGYSQLFRIKAHLRRVRHNVEVYKRHLKEVPFINFPAEPMGYRNSYWVFGITFDEKKSGVSVSKIREVLAGEGIETRSFFIPIHLQPIYYQDFKGQNFLVAERLSREGFYLPSYFGLKENQIKKISEVIKRCLKVS